MTECVHPISNQKIFRVWFTHFNGGSQTKSKVEMVVECNMCSERTSLESTIGDE